MRALKEGMQGYLEEPEGIIMTRHNRSKHWSLDHRWRWWSGKVTGGAMFHWSPELEDCKRDCQRDCNPLRLSEIDAYSLT